MIKPNHPWVAWAYNEMAKGVKRPESNNRIFEYFTNCNYHDGTTHLDWCSAFMSTAMIETGIESQRSIVARHWLKWGVDVPFTPGAVVVFWRGAPNSWQGHVGIAVGRRGNLITTLGGNQNGKVGVNNYDAGRVLGYRMPKGYSLEAYYKL